LPLADADVSRQHTVVVRRHGAVVVQDLGAKNGTWLASTRIASPQAVPWRSSQAVQVGQTVLVLEEPLAQALAEVEGAPDEVIVEAPSPPAAAPASATDATSPSLPAGAPVVAPARGRPTSRWSLADLLVMGAALGVLVASLAGLAWLLRR
jgi:hypothetical protein